MEPLKNITRDPAKDGSLYSCPCCGCRTLTARGCYEICEICYWEDDGQDDHDADTVRGGPNHELSLTQARINYREFGAVDQKMLRHVRKPRPEEI